MAGLKPSVTAATDAPNLPSKALGKKRQGGVMANMPRYTVVKTTTEKLQSELNDFNWLDKDLNPELVTLEHVGGRDWVVVVRTGGRSPEVALNYVRLLDQENWFDVLEKRIKARDEGRIRK